MMTPDERKEYHRNWYQNNKERKQAKAKETYDPIAKKAYDRRRTLRIKYGITPEQFDELLAAQDGACAICKTREPGGAHNNLHVDHCHDSGAVRGLLCQSCNTGLGHLGDNKQQLLKAIEYLDGAERKANSNQKKAA